MGILTGNGKRSRLWFLAGGAALVVVSALILNDSPGPPTAHQPTIEPSSQPARGATSIAVDGQAQDHPASDGAAGDPARDVSGRVPYMDANGVISRYGERIRFRHVADCSETYVRTLQGDWLPNYDCGPARLEVDHPYGSYTIAQLEYAADEMNDGDAAYILAERFASETWRDRRSDAHAYYLKAFLLTSDSEIYRRMLGEMGLHGGVSTKNGAVNVADLSANYTMFRVGQMFGVIDAASVRPLAAAAGASDAIDVAALERQARSVYESLLEARDRL